MSPNQMPNPMCSNLIERVLHLERAVGNHDTKLTDLNAKIGNIQESIDTIAGNTELVVQYARDSRAIYRFGGWLVKFGAGAAAFAATVKTIGWLK